VKDMNRILTVTSFKYVEDGVAVIHLNVLIIVLHHLNVSVKIEPFVKKEKCVPLMVLV
jgi:uncharacterized membrane protein YwzB